VNEHCRAAGLTASPARGSRQSLADAKENLGGAGSTEWSTAPSLIDMRSTAADAEVRYYSGQVLDAYGALASHDARPSAA
jgi:hypothetical protein